MPVRREVKRQASTGLALPEPAGPTTRVQFLPTGLLIQGRLTEAEWLEVGSRLVIVERAAQWALGDWLCYGEQRRYGALTEAAERLGVAYQTLNVARIVADRFELMRRRTTLPWSHHRVVAFLPPAEADRYLEAAERGENGQPWSEKQLRRAVLRRSLDPIPERPAFPPGQFAVLYADPPWRYLVAPPGEERAIESHYQTLSDDEIAGYQDGAGRAVVDLAAPDAVLYLWATNPKLREALAIVEAWGFTYVSNLVWVKDVIGMGYWARARHELLLVGRRGEPRVPDESVRPDSVIEAPRREHSEKPDLRPDIERWLPWEGDRPYVELFHRGAPRARWATYGLATGREG